MRCLLTILFLLPLLAIGQNPNFVLNTHNQYTVATRDIVVGMPTDTTSKKDYGVVWSFTGNGTNDMAAVKAQGPAKAWENNATGFHKDNFILITIIRTVGENGGVMNISTLDNIIDTVMKYCKFIDTNQFKMAGLSQGAQEAFRYLSDWGPVYGSYTPKHRHNFTHQVFASPGSYGFDYWDVFRVTNTKVAWGDDDVLAFWPSFLYPLFHDTYGYADPKTKKIQFPSPAGHDAFIWDSLWSLAGSTANNNTWMWLKSVTYGLANAPPVANAGLTQTIYSGTTATLTGSGSSDADGTIVSYAWTKITGASCTIVSASSPNTDITGLATGYYRFRLLVTDDDGATHADTVSVVLTSPRNRIAVRSADVFRNTGRDVAVPVQFLWDNDTTTSITAATYIADLDIPCDAYYLLPDSLYDNIVFEFYNGPTHGNINTRWTLYNEDFTDSIVVNKLTSTNQWQYVDSNTTKGAHFRVKFIKLFFDQALRDLMEMRIYGTGKALAQPLFTAPVTIAPLPYEDFQRTAINGDENDTLLVGGVSPFQAHWYWDSSTTYNSAARTMVASVYGAALPQLQSYRTSGKKINLAFFGSIRAFQSPVPTDPLNYGGYNENIKNIVPGSDPRLPSSWLPSAQEGFLIASWAGRATGINRGPHSIKTLGVEATQGNDVAESMEYDNEHDAPWSPTVRFQSNEQIAAKISAVADGHMGALGVYAGVKTADPSMLLATGARVGLDSVAIKSDAFFLYRLRGYDNNPVDIYFSNQYFVYGGQQSTGTHGISPGQFNWAEKARWFNSVVSRYFPGSRKGIREVGWDIRQTTYYSALQHGTLDSQTVQGNYLVLTYNIGRANDIDIICQYRSRNEELLSSPTPGPFNSSGQFEYHFDEFYALTVVRFKSSYWLRTNYNMLKRYDNIKPTTMAEGDSTGLYIYKYQNTDPSDTITVVLQAGTHDDSYFNYNLTVGNTSFCEKVTMASGQDNGVHTTQTPSEGVLSLTGIGETPIYIRYVPSEENINPLANAGINQTITLPTSSVTVSGSGSTDSDGTITAYAWTRLSGPNTPTIVSASSVSTNITGLIAGTYIFQLLVTDNDGGTDTDTVTITVNAESVIPPIKTKFRTVVNGTP